MRVAVLSYNAEIHNAVGSYVLERVRFFQERGARVRVLVENDRRLHPELRTVTMVAAKPGTDGPAWDELRQADLVFAVYGQYYELLQYLPLLAGAGPRIVFEYLGVTPPEFWPARQRESLDVTRRRRGFAWCADHVLTISAFARRELLDATDFPPEHVTILPPALAAEFDHAGPPDPSLRDRLGISGPILLFVGRVAANKRVPILIEALVHRPDAHLAIVGDCGDVYAAEAGRCRELAERLGVANRVHWLGRLDDAELARAYRGADLLVLPSVHEGFCVPVLEAMASGLPVLAARSAALPETIADAGLTFAPDDVGDLVRQMERVLPRAPYPQPFSRGERGGPLRIAVVCFRFGPDIVGGAETSLRSMAEALRDAGHAVEIFTTCTISEARWRNELPAGTITLARLPVHRFPIDPHDFHAHGESVRAILEADGRVAPELEERYLAHSIHSSALIAALAARREDFDAVIAGPYLFGLTADVARALGDKVILAPCFHDEPIARLSLWPRLYGVVGGVLYHSPEEQAYAQSRLGVNHPNAHLLGAWVDTATVDPPAEAPRPYVVYCGRYSGQKNVPMLLEWAGRYQGERPGRVDFVFLGHGEVKLPATSWVRDLGRVDDARKRAVLAGARALVQLSVHESLSLVVLEAWAQGTPVIARPDCAVLAGQIARSGGGGMAGSYADFAALLDDLLDNPAAWRERGDAGRRYVRTNYASREKYLATLESAIARLATPIAVQMRGRGIARAAPFSRWCWQERFAEFVEGLLTRPARACRVELTIEPLKSQCRAAVGARTVLVPVRLWNRGTRAIAGEGPGRSVVCCEVGEAPGNASVELPLPALIAPGEQQVAVLPVPVPPDVGSYRVRLWASSPAGRGEMAVAITLSVGAAAESPEAGCAATFLDAVHEALPRAHELAALPADYVDVSEGRLAPVKRLVKRKLLNNFKQAYVDVLSRQQSQVNEQVVLMIQHLAESCAMLDQAIAGLNQRLDGLEARLEEIADAGQDAESREVKQA